MNTFCYNEQYIRELKDNFVRLRRVDTNIDKVYFVKNCYKVNKYDCFELHLIDTDLKDTDVLIWQNQNTTINIQRLT